MDICWRLHLFLQQSDIPDRYRPCADNRRQTERRRHLGFRRPPPVMRQRGSTMAGYAPMQFFFTLEYDATPIHRRYTCFWWAPTLPRRDSVWTDLDWLSENTAKLTALQTKLWQLARFVNFIRDFWHVFNHTISASIVHSYQYTHCRDDPSQGAQQGCAFTFVKGNVLW